MNPDTAPCPAALVLQRQLGDYHLLVAGGLSAQPAGTWRAKNWAGYAWYVLEQEAEATPDFPIEKRLKPDDLKVLFDDLRPIRVRLIQHG